MSRGQVFDLWTEHLLRGLMRLESGVAASALTAYGIDIAKVRTAIEFIIGRGDPPMVCEVGLTPRAKRVIELTVEEARRLGHQFVGDGHLLLGILREGEGVAAAVLESLGVELDRLRSEVATSTAQLGCTPAGTTGAPGAQPRSSRQRVTSGSPWEDRIGFSRAVRVGDRVLVAGTAPIWPDGSCDPDPEKQARRCIEIILAALGEAGAGAEHVVRTRTYLVDPADVESVGRAHAEVFGADRPTSTMVIVAGFLDPPWKVEVEAEAQLD